MMVEERQHLGAHGAVVGRLAIDPGDHVGRLAVDRRLEQLTHAAPLVGCHRRRSSLSSRKSQARARLQRRFNVAGEMSSAAAASSIPRPAK